MYTCPECKKNFELDEEPDQNQIIFCPYCDNTIIFVESIKLDKDNTVGGFKIIEKIGQGGMGSVYLAEQLSMHRKVALKILDDNMTQDKAVVSQFMKEIKTTALLEHPAIVKAIDAGVDRDTYFFAMNYVEGTDLETYLETKGRLNEIRALKYVIKIAEALKYAWDNHRLLHRDIKPGNIMIDGDDDAFLLDMGIAQHFTESFEKQELIDGSPYYMSPEQTFAEPLSWSSDLYSLGATLYHLVVGMPPYDHDAIECIVEMHSAMPFPEPIERNPHVEISPATTELMRIMMAKEPSGRFKSWEEFISRARSILKELSSGKDPELLKSLTEENERLDVNKSNYLITIATFAAIFIALLLSVIFLLKGIAERKASKALIAAEEYVSQINYESETAVEKYGNAMALCSSYFVSSEKLERARKGYAHAQNELKNELQRRGAFRSGIEEINAMINNMNTLDPEEALKTYNEIKDKLIALSPRRESEFEKYQQIGKKLHILKIINENKLKKHR